MKICEKIIIDVIKGDITEVESDAIVNPANSLLVMGGGVAGAIKRKGGIEIEKEAVKKAPIPVGEAIATGGYKLKAKYVIHAPTMERPAMRTSKEKARKAALAALKLANDMNLKLIALPGMGTGVGGVSATEGANAIKDAIEQFINETSNIALQKIFLVAFDDELYREFKRIKNEMC
ncbi:MAG: macro domain-containing protein [Candidatus Njordarchaeia archaeon]